MTAFALALVLAAAVIHASWNYLLKRSGGGTIFVWWFATLSAAIYAPLAIGIIWFTRPQLGWAQAGLMLASAVLHTGYYLLLDRGYRSGDLSLVYPLARGSAPLITVICAVLLLQEEPSALALAGALLIASGAVGLTGNWRDLRASGNLHAVGFALLTGAAIASYTVVDKLAVAAFMVPPLLQEASRAAQATSQLRSQTTEGLALGIDEVPVTPDLSWFCRKCLHHALLRHVSPAKEGEV